MLKILSKYIRYSGVWLGCIINPFHWSVTFDFLHPDELNPNMRGFYACFGPFWIRVILDDGSW